MVRKKKKRASGLLTGVILLLLIFGVGIQLYRLQDQLKTARDEEAALSEEIEQLKQENADLEEDIANAGASELIEKIAREELGMAIKDEKVFYTTGG